MLYLSILFSTGSFILKSNAVFGLKKERESRGRKLPNRIQTLPVIEVLTYICSTAGSEKCPLPVSFSVLLMDPPASSAFLVYDHGNVDSDDLINWDHLIQTFTKPC